MNSKFYYGLPEHLWENLYLQAEDLLRDRKLGAYIVGMYPAGERIYGVESGAEGIMCLYIDTVESLINPLVTPKSCDIFHINGYGSPVIMFNLFEWVKWLVQGSADWKTNSMLHAIPFGELVEEDSSIADIINAAQELMTLRGFRFPTTTPNPRHNSREFSGPYILRRRAEAILAATGSFMPCVNPKWNTVFNMQQLDIPEDVLIAEKYVVNRVIHNIYLSPIDIQLLRLDNWYEDIIKRHIILSTSQLKEAENTLGKLTEKLYRFQL